MKTIKELKKLKKEAKKDYCGACDGNKRIDLCDNCADAFAELDGQIKAKEEVVELIDERISWLRKYDPSNHQIHIRGELLLLKFKIKGE